MTDELQRLRVACCESLGWHDIYDTPTGPMGFCDTEGISRDIPDLTNDFAHELVEALRKEGWNCEVRNGLDGEWECEFSRPVRPDSPSEHVGIFRGEERELYYGPALTFPIAVALAAAKTWGIEV